MNAPSLDIKDMLVSAGIDLVFAENLFVSRLPEKPDNVVMIRDTAGRADMLTYDGKRVENPSVQIIVRHRDFVQGWNMIQQIREQLHGRANEAWNGSFYIIIKVASAPAVLDYDDNDRLILVINFLIQRR